MKALSIQQPWASLIRDGIKSLEVRTWRTHHRGELLVVASKRPDTQRAARRFEIKEPVYGASVCVVDLVGIRKGGQRGDRVRALAASRGKWVWEIANPRMVEPVRIHGQFGIYEVPAGKVYFL